MDIANVVFGSEFIGLKYSVKCKSGLTISNIQSKKSQKTFVRNIKRNKPQVKNNIFCEKLLLSVKSIENFSRVLTINIQVLFNKLESLFNALLNKYNTTKNITIKIQVENTVFEI
jgi:hypothetical protein